MRGALSVLTAAITSLIVISALTAYFVAMSRSSISAYRTAVLQSMEELRMSVKGLKAYVTNEGLKLETNEPPIELLGVIAVYPQGTYQLLRGPTQINKTSFIALDRDIVDSVRGGGGRLVVAASGGLFLVANLEEPVNNGSVSSNATQGGSGALSTPPLDLTPYTVTGLLINSTSFIANPIPGTVNDVEANYEPSVYIKLGRFSTDLLADIVTVAYNDGYHTFLISNNPVGQLILVPLKVSRSVNTSETLYAYHIIVDPLYCPNENIARFYMELRVKPVIYAVLPLDYLRTYLVTKPGRVMFMGQFKNSVARTIYSCEGEEVRAELEAWGSDEGCTHRVPYEGTIFLNVNPVEVLKNIPQEVSEVVILSGLLISLTYDIEGDVSGIVNPYAELTVGIYNLSKEYEVSINDARLLNKPLLLNVHIPGVVPHVVSPPGGNISLYRAVNVESTTYSRLLWFNVTELGTYRVKLSRGELDSLPALNVPIEGVDYGMGLAYIHNEYKRLQLTTSSTRKYVVEPSSGVLVRKYFLNHSFQGRVYWYSNLNYDGVVAVYSNITPSAEYRVSSWSSLECPEVVYGWSPVTSDLNANAYLYYSNRCNPALKLAINYSLDSQELVFTSNVYVYGMWLPYYTIEVMVNDTVSMEVLSSGSINIYTVDSESTLGLLNLKDVVKTIIEEG